MSIRLSVAVLAVAMSSTTGVSAGTFDVKSPEVTKGETEFSVNSSFFRGYPENAELLRHSWEVGISRGLTNWWSAGLKTNLDQPIGESFRAATVGTEHLFMLRKTEGGFGLAWYTGVDVAVATDQTNTVTFGPVVQFGTDKTALTLNPFLAQTFGRNKEDGIALAYGWQFKHEVREGFAVGIESFGQIKNLGSGLGSELQEHRIGPVVYFERDIAPKPSAGLKDAKGRDGADGPKFKFETGVLFGMTSGTQDTTLKVKGGITF